MFDKKKLQGNFQYKVTTVIGISKSTTTEMMIILRGINTIILRQENMFKLCSLLTSSIAHALAQFALSCNDFVTLG